MDVSKHSIASFMSNSLVLSYNRVSSRPLISSIPQTQLKKIIFWLEFMNLVKLEHIVVNIEDILFSRSTKINYPLTKKGVWSNFNNSTLIRSLSLLASITNKRDWFISNLLTRNNSNNFITFIENLMAWLQKDLYIEACRIVLMMDNYLIHTLKKPRNY